MGILDDAIRQHLDLKRETGADESEVKQLEDEAFGPAARPGDKDFPTSGGEAIETPAGPSEAEAPSEEEPAAEAPSEEQPAAEAPSEEQPAAEGVSEEQPIAEAPSEEQPVAEAPSEEHPIAEAPSGELELGDEQAAPPGGDAPPAVAEPDEAPSEPALELEPEPAEAPSSFTTAEREAIADQPTAFFDQAGGSALDMGELDLDLDEEIQDVGLGQPEVPAAEQLEPPHAAEPEPTPIPESAPISEPEPQDLAQPPAAPEGAESGEEDVLEETPEFLRENPDDDELWFEQGEPKDFDF